MTATITDPRLYAVVLRLAALRPGALPPDHGKQALSALYALLDHGDAALARTLHNANAAKPFTVAPLTGGKRDAHGAQHFGEGTTAEWRFTLLRDPAFAALIQRYVLDRSLPHVRIGALTFGITEAFVSGSHPDSGSVSLSQLTEQFSAAPETYPRTFVLDFKTPTAFNLGTDRESGARRLRTLPDPRTIFSALRKKWSGLGGAAPGDEFDEWVERWVEAEPLHLRWQTVAVEGMPIRGFCGAVRFTHWGTDVRWLACLHLLAALSFYTGVGYQTTRGLGQTRQQA